MSQTTRMILAARGGDRVALDELCRRHHGRLLAFVQLRLPATPEARSAAGDIVQETYLEAIRKIQTFVPERASSFYSWLVGIAKNKLREANRSAKALRRVREVPLETHPVAEQTSLPDRAARLEGAERLREALGSLPDDQARAVALRYLEGRTVAETASELQRSPAAVKALVARGLSSLGRKIATLR